jgi:hypothetical protein
MNVDVVPVYSNNVEENRDMGYSEVNEDPGGQDEDKVAELMGTQKKAKVLKKASKKAKKQKSPIDIEAPGEEFATPEPSS